MKDPRDSVPEEIRLWLLSRPERIWVAGGAVRDVLLGRALKDLDLTVSQGARSLAEEATRALEAVLVPLHEDEGVFRVAYRNFFLDFSEFRRGSQSLEEDLRQRDFTINAMAVSVSHFFSESPKNWPLVDPVGGRRDLSARIIRAIALENLLADPLRLLRAYRLAASLDFVLEATTRGWISSLALKIDQVAKERVGAEIKILFEHPAGQIVSLMAEDDLLFVIFPELKAAQGVAQPSFHHLDVLGHLLLALEKADLLLENPHRFFGLEDQTDPFREILEKPEKQAAVRLASLFHDLGKPQTFAIRHRITFYEHDRVGAELFKTMGERLRFSKKFVQKISLLIRHHMRPFHLLRDFKEGRLTRRALRRLLKDCPDYVSLFLVAMADSLASAGPDKEEGLESALAALFWEVHRFQQEILAPQEKKRLVSGRDLIDLFGLEPGPLFKELLEAVEVAQIEGKIKTREEALAYLSELITRY